MLKKIISSLAVLIACLAAHAQNISSDTSTTCVAYWREGDVKNLQINKLTRTLENGKEKEFNLSSYEARLTVVDSTDKGYILEWAYQPAKNAAKASAQNKIDDILQHLKILYKTSNDGSFDSLLNYEDIQKVVQESLTEIADSAAGNAAFKNAIEKVKLLFQTRANIEQIALREISLYHTPYGVIFSAVHPQKMAAQFPDFLGGDPFPAILTLSLTKLDKAKDLATITVTQEIDKAKAAKILNTLFNKPDPTNKTLVSKDQKLREIQITDKTTYELELSTGWLKRVYTSREVKTGSLDKIEACEIRVH